MRSEELKKLTENEAETAYMLGEISRFEFRFRDFLLGRCEWKTFTGRDLQALREHLSLTQEVLGGLLNVSKQTILRWEKEGEALPVWAYPALTFLDRLEDGIFEVMRRPSRRDAGCMADMSLPFPREGDPDDWNDRVHVPSDFGPEEVKTLRRRLHVTRKGLAEMMDVSLSSVDKWESGAVSPKGPALIVLKLLWKRGPKGLKELER